MIRLEYPNVNGVTSGTETNVLEEIFSWGADKIKSGIGNFLKWSVVSILDFTEPFYNWGCKAIVIACFTIFFITGDKKPLTTAFKAFLISLLLIMIRGALQ